MQTSSSREALDREVLPEGAVLEVVAFEELLPVPVRLDLVDEDGADLPTVPSQVALPVTVDVQPAHHPRPGDRALPDSRVHGPAAPGHVLRHPDVDRQQCRHRLAPSRSVQASSACALQAAVGEAPLAALVQARQSHLPATQPDMGTTRPCPACCGNRRRGRLRLSRNIMPLSGASFRREFPRL